MSDLQLRDLRRAAQGTLDVESWLRLVQPHLRTGDWDAAAQAATIAAGALDMSETMDRLTPGLDDFVAEERAFDVLPATGFRWTPEGSGIYGLVDQGAQLGRVQLEIAEVDLASDRVHSIFSSSSAHTLYYNRAHPVIDPAGRYVVFGCSDPRGESAVMTADRASGALLGRVTRCREELHELTVSGSNVVTCREAYTTRFFQLDPGGLARRARALRALRWGVRVIPSSDGVAFVRFVPPDHAGLFDLAADLPRASVPATDHDHVLPVGRRVVIVSDSLVRLHGPAGELLGEAPRPAGFHGVPIPSPSGRLLAFNFRAGATDGEPRIEFLDLRTGQRRSFRAYEDPFYCRWSPSGRKLLAVATGRASTLLVAA